MSQNNLENSYVNFGEKIKISKIADISEGVVKIKGRIFVINKIEAAPLSQKQCIGYSLRSLSYEMTNDELIKSKKGWRTLNASSKSENFYIGDGTGKVLVKAEDILIALSINKFEKKYSSTLIDVENLLLEDETEYILVGTAKKTPNGTIVIQKKKNAKFFIMDLAFQELLTDTIPFFKKKFISFVLPLLISALLVIVCGYIFTKAGLYHNKDNSFSRGMLVAIFSFGNFAFAFILSGVCYIVKPIKFLYNILGPISAGILLATFINLLILSLLIATDSDEYIMFFAGIIITVACCIFTLFHRKRLWKLSIMSKRL